MTCTRHIAILLSTLGLAACDTPPPAEPPQPGNVMVDDDGRQVVAGAAGNYDVSPVAEPGEMVMHLRWKAPAATLATLAGFANLPAASVNTHTRTLVAAAIDEAVGNAVDAERLAPLVHVDAPLDMVGVADTKRSRQVPDPMFAWSIGLTSVEAALETSRGKPRELQSGVWRIGTASEWGPSCAIAASAGTTPGRLVCVEERRHLEPMVAYMARNVAAMPSQPADVHAEIRLRGLLDKYGRTWANQARGLPIIAEEFKLGIPAADQAMLDAAEALAKEAGALIHDADTIVADVSLDAQKGIAITSELRFAGAQSWTVQTMVDGAELASAPPDLFWRLPIQSETVAWGRAGDPARYTDILSTTRAIADGLMAKEKFGTAADRKAITGLLRSVSQKHAVYATASGHFDDGKSQGAFRDMIDATVGWHIVGVEEPAAELRKYLNELVQVYNRPSLQTLMKKEMGSDAKHLPKVSVVPAPRGLGGGSLDIKILVPQVEDPMSAMSGMMPSPDGAPPDSSKPALVDIEAHILLMSDGNRTWIGFATDRERLAALMEAAKGETAGAATISKKTSLSSIKSAKHNAMSVSSLDGLIGTVKPSLMMFVTSGLGMQSISQQILDALQKMPHKGQTPIVFAGDVKAGAKPSVKVSAHIPRETLVDVGHLVNQAMTIAQP